MKKVDLLILRSYLGPFVMTFAVVLFLHIMQFFFVYIDDFVGKGLEWYIVAELVFYLSANTVPLALPLAVLLSSIMTYGNLGERYELIALKSAGVHLLHFMRASIVFIAFIALASLAFSNYAMPTANLKFYTTLLDITQQKPALNIKENVFYSDIEDYMIKIAKKGDDNRKIKGVYISNQKSHRSNDDIMIADSGEMFMSGGGKKEGRYLVLKLYNGRKYEVLPPENQKQGKLYVRTYFEEMEKVFDLSEFKMTRTNEEMYKDHYIMLDIEQLKYYIDSLDRDKDTLIRNFHKYVQPYFYFSRDSVEGFAHAPLPDTIQGGHIINYLQTTDKSKLYSRAITFAKNIQNHVDHPVLMRMKSNDDYIVRARIELHRKYVLAAACLILLFIGAPFGAIVRLGGFGWPVLFSVLFYIVYFVLFKLGESFAQKQVLPTWLGMWLPTVFMIPISILLTQKAMTDSAILFKEGYIQFLRKLGDRIQKAIERL